MRVIFLLLSLLGVFLSCSNKDLDERFSYTPKFIIDGNIEVDNFPVVKITHNIPINAKIDSALLEQIIIRWAKVEVESKDDTEVLTLIHDKNLFPYYYYKGRRLKGKLGETYKLKVTYNDIVMEGETYIPDHLPEIDSIWFKDNSVDTMRKELYIRIFDDTPTLDYYRFYTRPDSIMEFSPTTPKFTDDSKFINQYFESSLYRNRLSNFEEPGSTLFLRHVPIVVKVSNMNKQANDFWNRYQELSANIPLFGGNKLLQGNITGPCIGIWYGTASQSRIITPN